MISNYTGISGSRSAYVLASALKEHGKLLAVVSSGQAAARLAGDLLFCMPGSNIIVLPEEEDTQILYEARDRGVLIRRIEALTALVSPNRPDISDEPGAGTTAVIAPVSAAVRHTESPERFRASMISLSVGDVSDPADLKNCLIRAGYIQSSVTESAGEFTSRGGILDVFSPASEYPFRIEFFDDEIDSIRSYDPATQRSIEQIQSIILAPAVEFTPDNAEKEKALAAVMKDYDRMIKGYMKEHAHPDVADGRIDLINKYKGRVQREFSDIC